jgi:hypothetical protein
MAKEKTKISPKQQSPFGARLAVLLKVGNYGQVRRIAKSNLSPDDRETAAAVILALEPNPFVLWIGLGSVALATALALWLTF